MIKFGIMNFVGFIYFFLCVFLIAQDDGYFGGWPVNQNKDDIKDPGIAFSCDDQGPKKNVGCQCTTEDDCYTGRCFNSPRVGKYCLQNTGTVFPRYKLTDQYGEVVDLYDFAGHGKMIVIEFSTSWCLDLE